MDENKLIKYIDENVYDMAKKRIRHVINTFDHVCVAFSGGKDSLAALNLTLEVYKDLGIDDPLDVIFRDEELIPDDVINFVQAWGEDPRINLRYYAVPLKSNKYILGRTYDYIQWDVSRRWLRDKPQNAITELPIKKHIYSQYDMDLVFEHIKGKVGLINGIRASESIVRLRSCVNKRTQENYINATESPRVKMVKPIYDWSENDVFKYFYDNKIEYCSIYDNQIWNNQKLRVSTPLHSEAAKQFDRLATLYPVFYNQLIDIFPEMLVQAKYFKEYDRNAVYEQYPASWDGIMQYIDENLEGKQIALAKKRVIDARKNRENNRAAGKGSEKNYWGYPILYVFNAIIAGGFKRVLLPCPKATQKHIEFEQRYAEGLSI